MNDNMVLPPGSILKGRDAKAHAELMEGYDHDIRKVFDMVRERLGDSIGYAGVMETYFLIEPSPKSSDMVLHSFVASPSIWYFDDFEGMVDHLSDPHYLNYFVKCLPGVGRTSMFKLYAYRVCNVANLRAKKLDELGI